MECKGIRIGYVVAFLFFIYGMPTFLLGMHEKDWPFCFVGVGLLTITIIFIFLTVER